MTNAESPTSPLHLTSSSGGTWSQAPWQRPSSPHLQVTALDGFDGPPRMNFPCPLPCLHSRGIAERARACGPAHLFGAWIIKMIRNSFKNMPYVLLSMWLQPCRIVSLEMDPFSHCMRATPSVLNISKSKSRAQSWQPATQSRQGPHYQISLSVRFYDTIIQIENQVTGSNGF